MDYAAWAQRASNFLRGLTWLPGGIEISDGIESPATSEFDREWLHGDTCSLPPELKRFLETASKRCQMRYVWKIPNHTRPRIGKIWADCDELSGGADFCQAARFSNHDSLGMWGDENEKDQGSDGSNIFASMGEDLLARVQETLASTGKELSPEKLKTALKQIEEMPKTFAGCMGIKDEKRDRGRIRLLELDDNSQVCLQLETVGGMRPVVYVDEGAPEQSSILSESFDQFLHEWENICYLKPTRKNLDPWLDPTTGRLHSENDNSNLLRELLTSSCRAQFDHAT